MCGRTPLGPGYNTAPMHGCKLTGTPLLLPVGASHQGDFAVRVLIVEDDPVLARTLLWVAEEQGDDAHVCHTGRDAIATARALRPHLVVVDMELPDMDGTEVCRSVRGGAETALATVVAHTAYSDTAVRQKAQAAGCHAFFVKGVDFRNLMTLLTTMHAGLKTSPPDVAGTIL